MCLVSTINLRDQFKLPLVFEKKIKLPLEKTQTTLAKCALKVFLVCSNLPLIQKRFTII